MLLSFLVSIKYYLTFIASFHSILKSRTRPLTFLRISPCKKDRVKTKGACVVVELESSVEFKGTVFSVVVKTIMPDPGLLVVGSG